MASPMNETWWSTFLSEHGRDSEEQTAFEGYLVSQGIAADSGPDVLEEAYAAFHTYMLESGARASADPGPTRAEVMAGQAVAGLVEHVPQSKTANPGMNKPLTSATHPQAQEIAKLQAAAGEGERPEHPEHPEHPAESPAAAAPTATAPAEPHARGTRRTSE